MNNQIIYKPKKRNKRKIIISIFFVITLIVVAGTSYAMWQMTLVQTNTNKLTTACIDITLTNNSDSINLENAYPMEFNEEELTPYQFTLENTCTTDVSYYINLENVTGADKKLDESAITLQLKKEGQEILIDNAYSNVSEEEIILETALSAHRLYEGYLVSGGKATFELRLCLDEFIPAEDEYMNASYESKITIRATQQLDSLTDNILINAKLGEIGDEVGYQRKFNFSYVKDGTSSYISKLKKIVFENSKNPYPNAEKVYDFSQVQNGSILGYYVKDTDDKYILYIQADGNIKIDPENSEWALLIDETTTVELEGLENIEATNLSNLFNLCQFLTKVDLSKLDTSNVTDMSSMFFNCSKVIATINIMNKDANYEEIFFKAAIEEGSQITLNYTKETESLVDEMIANKDEESNIVKGILLG